MNLEVISKQPHEGKIEVNQNGNSKLVSNGSKFLSASYRPKSSRLTQPRPSVWTLKDVQKALPKEGPTSLFVFREGNIIRKYAKFIAESKAFEYFILLTILFNCIVLAFDAPLPENDKSSMNEVAEKIEYYFLAIFLFELVVKIIAMGFVLHPKSYLRSGWNFVDFVVVITGLVILILGHSGSGTASINIKSLRAVRVLRPLKLISGIPSLQVVMTSIVRAMFPLMQVLFLVVFVIIIFAIIGLEFLRGRFSNACYNESTKTWQSPITPCDPDINKQTFFVYGKRCPANYVCKAGWEGPNSGISSFDNIFLAMLTVFQCITMEGWTDVMYTTFYARDEHGYIYSSYYIALIVIGSFFMLNLVLGVLSGEFAKEREKVENRRSFLKLRQAKQIDRQYDCYLEWIMKGEEIMAQQGSQESNAPPNENIDRIGDAALNPAIVFTANRYKFNSSSNHRKSKFDRIKQWIKLSRIRIRVLVKHGAFYWTVLVMVFLNTCIVATNHYQQPAWLTNFQDVSEIVFVTIFTCEMLLKLYGLGPKLYFHSMFNMFDCIVVSLSILEIIIVRISVEFNLGLSVMRSLRLLRIFKVTKYWSSLRNLISSLMNGMKSILSLMFLLFLFIVISALLGMQLFGGKFEKLEQYPRTNFDSFPDSMLAVFQIMTGEDWNAVMYNGINAYGGPKTINGVLISLYFVLLVVFGNYTLLNVFLAIAVDNLTNAEILSQDEEDEQKALTRQRTARTGFTGPGLHWTKLKALSFVRTLQKQVAEDERRENPDQSVLANSSASSNAGRIRKETQGIHDLRENHANPQIQKKWKKILQQQSSVPIVVENSSAVSEDQNKNLENIESANFDTDVGDNGEPTDEGTPVDKIISEEGMLNFMKTNVAERRRVKKQNPAFREVSMFIFTQENPIRRFCHAVVHHKFFDPFIMGVILISSLTLAIEDPLNDDSKRNKVLQYFDYVFAAIFSLEVILKFVDVGIVLHKGSYFRDYWNILDFFVVACNIASIVMSVEMNDSRSKTGQTVKALRVLRVLRPLKAISKIKKLKAVFQCMIFSLKNVLFVLIITLLFLFIFACIGVQLFKGKFYYCTDSSKMTKDECRGQFYVFPSKESVIDNKPNVKKREWKQYDFHFDDLFAAMLTLYTTSTGEGWPNAMHQTIDATQVDRGPITNYNQALAIYFVVFVIVFTFMIINIYVALIILTFQRQGEKELTEGGLDRNQRDCIHFALTSKAKPRYMPNDKHSFSYRVWYVVDSRPFEFCIMIFIALNTLQLMMQYHGSSETYKEFLKGLNITFVVLFCFEAILKIIAYRLNYFKDFWNLFDFLVVLGSVFDIIISNFKFEFLDTTMFRLCRAARIIKLLRTGTSIRLMLWTFLQSFKALPYVTALILLLFYMYAVIGMQMFSKIQYGDVITEYNNFRTIIQALQVLFRSATGESWNNIMRACYSDAPCVANSTSCGNKYLAIFYFSTFIFLCMFLLLNLFVAVIMDNFEYLTRDSSILGPHHLDEFVRVWSEFDPSASERIHHQMLYTLMCHMAPPVGFGKKCPKSLGYKRLIRMNMPVGGDQTVTFHSTLFALIRTSLEIKMKGNMFKNDQELRRAIQVIWPNMQERNIDKILPKQTATSSQQMTVGKIYCVKLLITNYRVTKAKEETSPDSDEQPSTPSVFKRFISSFRRRGSRRLDDEAIELKVRPHDELQRSRTLSYRSSDSRGPNGQLTREGRRRSSWHDLGSFFRQREGSQLESADGKDSNAETKETNIQLQGNQPQATVIPNKNASGRVQNVNPQTATSRALNTGATAGSTASQLTPGSRQHSAGYRNQELNRNGMVRFSTGRDPNHRGAGSRSYSNGKPVTRSYSAGAVDYQRVVMQQRADHRGIASPNYRNPTSVGRQSSSTNAVSSSNSSNPSPHSVMHSLSNANSSSQQSIHSLPNFSIASPSNSIHAHLGLSTSRSAPISMDNNSNDYRYQGMPSHAKPGTQIYHSGPPFYGPPNSVDPSSIPSQSVRLGAVPKSTGSFPPQVQQGYVQSQQSTGTGMVRPVNGNTNDIRYPNQKIEDRSRMINHLNQMPVNGPRMNKQLASGPSNRQGNSKEPYEEDDDLLNGRQTQQYYDQMIAQINDKIAKAVERGQSPYAMYAANDDEESDWC